MLDKETKKRINDLRNILVGKIPNPESQVQQITTGLIYKFMHDIDQESVSMGGLPSFFTGEFEIYSWDKLMDSQLGGVKKVALYSEAVEKMYTNPNAPKFFREIFKNSFLPFKDPITLGMFLKEINKFHYSHSEKLGDAFEYLLSFLDSQGDAGQFRTPRHIIDFIVAVVSPSKSDSILDPACGTGGFLISSYKHILDKNTAKNRGDLITANERKELNNNVNGYDISPEMTRLSLVNLYLHSFSNPKIFEYDTLSRELLWDQYFDVILANPPFFTPKGGIKPHSRFSVKSSKAEVLFVDYILEHLRPGGKAGIIVPEGIISRPGNAYKNLRGRLINESLIGIISLPNGIFEPYSGVKTSILFLDKTINSNSDFIFFGEIKNDGYALSKQRTPINKNDLPTVQNDILKLLNNEESNLLKIQKTTLLQKSDYSLNKALYENKSVLNNLYPLVKLGNEELFEVVAGGTPKSTESTFWDGDINWISLADLPQDDLITNIYDSKRKITEEGLLKSSARLLPINTVIVSTRAIIGRIAINKIPLSINQDLKILLLRITQN